MEKRKKGISPLIATVLIIGFTVSVGAIIIIWGARFIDETTAIEKSDYESFCTEKGWEKLDEKRELNGKNFVRCCSNSWRIEETQLKTLQITQEFVDYEQCRIYRVED